MQPAMVADCAPVSDEQIAQTVEHQEFTTFALELDEVWIFGAQPVGEQGDRTIERRIEFFKGQSGGLRIWVIVDKITDPALG